MGSRVDISLFSSVLTLQKLTTSRGISGQLVETYVDSGSFLGSVEELSSSEKSVSEKEILLDKIRVTTYYSPDLKNTARLRYEDGVYEIIAIAKIESIYQAIEAVRVFE